MTCPLCLTEFVVPEGGLPALPRNVYIETILHIQRRARHLKSAAATPAAGSPASVDGGRRSCTSVVQSSKDRGDDWPTPSVAERGDIAELCSKLLQLSLRSWKHTTICIVKGSINNKRTSQLWKKILKSQDVDCENTIDPLVPTLKLHSNVLLIIQQYSDWYTLAVDGWAVTFGTARRGLGGLGPRPIPSSLYQI